MLSGIFHQGSGLGDQLFRYITVRSLAADKGMKWGMHQPERFKGQSFMRINMGQEITEKPLHAFMEKDIRDADGDDIRSYDPEINFVSENTVIDGCFEDEKYWGHHLKDMQHWLEVEPIDIPDTTCVIGFRGGEYATVPNLFLPKDYWHEAIMKLHELAPDVTKYEVHTDDVQLASEFFPNIKVIHDIGINWRSVRFAKHAIIANSAFYVIPRLLRHNQGNAVTIAPRYWARRNIHKWARPASFYPEFLYV